MSETRTISVIVTGRVQGVSYRAWTQSEARARGLAGSVRNRDDGTVEAVFSGAPEAVAVVLGVERIERFPLVLDAMLMQEVTDDSLTQRQAQMTVA